MKLIDCPSRWRWRALSAVAVVLAVAGCTTSTERRTAPPASTRTTPATAAPTPATSATGSTAPAAPTSTTTHPPAAPNGPCRGAPPPAAVQHVVVIVMENRALAQVAGSPSAPFLDRLATECGSATGYSAVAHPSLPNYIALTSGSTQGISDDSGPAAHPLGGPSIFSLLGTGWRSLEESMPAECDHSSGGEYATKHNPAVYFTTLRSQCAAQDVPMDDAAPDVSARFTLVTPNLCNDGHDCSTATADRWLSAEVPLMIGSAQYRAGATVLFVTWDENDAGGTLVPLYVIAPSVPPGLKVSLPYSHYSLLRTAEELLGLSPLLGAAASAPSMRSAFHL